MKKFIVTVVCVIILAALSSCSKEPSPENRFSEYIQLWNKQKFAKMYEYLSADAKKSIKKDDFINRYKKIYKDLEVTNLDIQYNQPSEKKKTKENKTKLLFSVKMQTLAGPIEFDHSAQLIKEKQSKAKAKDSKSENKQTEDWFIDWNQTYIFPELKNPKDKVSIKTKKAERGEIHDRYGDPMALNGIAFEIGIVPEKMDDSTISRLSRLLSISESRINKALSAKWVKPSYFVPIAKISEQETALLNKLYKIPGVDKKDVTTRVYPFGEAAAHLIGTTGSITATELEKHADKGYTATDIIGKRGLEQVLDKKLKGKDGVSIFIQKEDGTQVILAEKPVKNGELIELTIDATMQMRIFAELKGEAGAAAAIDPITGETLALVSSPSFDPNKMTTGMTDAELKALEGDKQQPLLNRFKSTFVPGSVIKPVTSSIALAAKTITPDQKMDIKGLTWQKDKTWGKYSVTRVYDPKTPVNLEKALLFSDNIYFAQLTLKMGKAKFETGLKEFGFEEEIPYLYPLEVSSIGKLETDRNIADTGYGQGQIETNVLHIATAYTPLLNDGNLIKPTLTLDEKTGQIWKKGVLSKDDAKTISDFLLEVVENPRGTAYSGKITGIPFAGKTGTAELKQQLDEDGAQLGWFVGYKTEEPNLLIAMMIENVQDRGGSKIPVTKVSNIFKQGDVSPVPF